MKWILTTIMFSLIAITFWLWQTDGSVALIANERLKNAANRAAHAASLQINGYERAQGRIIFDPVRADDAFVKTLADNLALDYRLSPKPNTLFQKQVTMLFKDYIDHDDGVTFPYYYENTTYGLRKTLKGPAVIYVVSVPKPVVNNISDRYEMRKAAIYEYPTPD